MRIKDILSPESMIMDLQATTKDEAINEMADLEVATGIVNNKEKFVESIWAREKESTTGIGGGIAMPHARNEYINKARVLFAKSEKGVDYDSGLFHVKLSHTIHILSANHGLVNSGRKKSLLRKALPGYSFGSFCKRTLIL